MELAIQDNRQIEEMVAVNQQNCDDVEDTVNVTDYDKYISEKNYSKNSETWIKQIKMTFISGKKLPYS